MLASEFPEAVKTSCDGRRTASVTFRTHVAMSWVWRKGSHRGEDFNSL